MKSEILSDLEIRRYSQQINLPSVSLKGQEKIKQSKVLIIGAGGKGTNVMQNLVAAGIGKLGISDNYLVEENILPNQRLYGNRDLGKQKAIISKQKLKEINYLVDIELHNICLSENNIDQICENYDILVDATNNFPSHYLINDASIRLNKPVVYGSVIKSQGQIAVFNYNNGPSFRYLFPEMLSNTEDPNMTEVTSIGIINNIVGTFMANEVLKIILGFKNVISGGVLIFNLPNYSIEFKKNINKSSK